MVGHAFLPKLHAPRKKAETKPITIPIVPAKTAVTRSEAVISPHLLVFPATHQSYLWVDEFKEVKQVTDGDAQLDGAKRERTHAAERQRAKCGITNRL